MASNGFKGILRGNIGTTINEKIKHLEITIEDPMVNNNNKVSTKLMTIYIKGMSNFFNGIPEDCENRETIINNLCHAKKNLLYQTNNLFHNKIITLHFL